MSTHPRTRSSSGRCRREHEMREEDDPLDESSSVRSAPVRTRRVYPRSGDDDAEPQFGEERSAGRKLTYRVAVQPRNRRRVLPTESDTNTEAHQNLGRRRVRSVVGRRGMSTMSEPAASTSIGIAACEHVHALPLEDAGHQKQHAAAVRCRRCPRRRDGCRISVRELPCASPVRAASPVDRGRPCRHSR